MSTTDDLDMEFADEDGEHEKILDLLERGVVKLAMTENGDVGVWLWRQDMTDDQPYASGYHAHEALLEAAQRMASERASGAAAQEDTP